MERITRAAAELGLSKANLSSRRVRYILSVVLAATMLPAGTAVAAGTLTNASVSLSDPRPSQTGVAYTFTGSSVDGSATVKCVQAVWSTTSAGDHAPAGFSGASGSVAAASSTLINSSATGWSLARSDGTSSSGQNNIYQYTNSTGVVPSTTSAATFVLSGVTSPSTADLAWFFKINTYGNTDCASSPIDNATVTFINTSSSQLSLTIDDSLSFTVNGVANGQSCGGGTTGQTSTATTLPFGSVSAAANVFVCQDLSAATNATNGYSIYARYTGPPTSGAHNIADLTPGTNTSPGAFSAAGTEAYGYTTNDQTLGTGTANRFFNGSTYSWAAMTTSNAEVAYESGGVANTTYRIGHQAGVSISTPAGSYSTTIIYTCTPVY